MNSTPMSQPMSTELLSETPIGNLLSSLDEATRARVLEERFMKCPLVMATKPFAKRIQQKLMKYSYFDIEQGRFIRIKVNGNGKLGPMGYTHSLGYIIICVDYTDFYQSQLVYLWLNGCFPGTGEQIDHIDGNRANDHPENLRKVLEVFNHRNQKRHSRNTSGYTGVQWASHAGKWRSLCRGIHIGYFNTAEEAYTARQVWIAARPELGFTSRHGT
jgi:hypothetical protein